MSPRTTKFLLLSAIIFSAPLDALAAPTSDTTEASNVGACAIQVKRCLGSEGIERTSCFYFASINPACEQDPLGSLAEMRYHMAPVVEGEGDTIPSLTGPRMIDVTCVARFDQTLRESEVWEDGSEERVTMLKDELSKCSRDIPSELLQQ